MEFTLILISVFAFVTLLVVGVCFIFLDPARKQDRDFRHRLLRVTDIASHMVHRPASGSVLREKYAWANPLQRLLRLTFPGWSDLALRLERAGIAASPSRFARIWVLAISLLGFLGFLSPLGTRGLILGFLSGWALPILWLFAKRRKREKAFERQFPDALRLLASSLKAGHAVQSCIQLVGEEFSPPLGQEFLRLSEETRLGLGMEDALRNMLDRVSNVDLRFFVVSLAIQRETGGNLVYLLQQIENLIRERFKIRGQVKALTAPGRLSGILLGIMPLGVGLIMAMLNPTYMAPLWETRLGRWLALTGFALQIIGYLTIRRIVNLRY